MAIRASTRIDSDEEIPAAKDRPLVPPGTRAKACWGPFCRRQLRPLSEFHLQKGGKSAGRPRTYCKECDSFKARKYRREWKLRNPGFYEEYYRERNIRNRKHQEWQHYGLVPYAKVGFAVEALCRLFGPTRAATRIGVRYGTLHKWRKNTFASIRKEHAARILRAFKEARDEANTDKT